MRVTGGIALGIVATLVGASAAVSFALAGLVWSDGFTQGQGWEQAESTFGVTIGVASLVGWLALLAASVVTLLAGKRRQLRSARVQAVLVALVSVAVVVTLCVLALLTPQPPSEYPLPPWNRA